MQLNSWPSDVAAADEFKIVQLAVWPKVKGTFFCLWALAVSGCFIIFATFFCSSSKYWRRPVCAAPPPAQGGEDAGYDRPLLSRSHRAGAAAEVRGGGEQHAWHTLVAGHVCCEGAAVRLLALSGGSILCAVYFLAAL